MYHYLYFSCPLLHDHHHSPPSKPNKTTPLNPNAKPFFSSSHPKKPKNPSQKWVPSLHGKTTVMIKNIPNRFLRGDLVCMLDHHCRLENARAVTTPKSQYDFVYLPIDFKKRANKGYAFVNMTSSEAAVKLCTAFHNFKWNVHKSKKICQVTMANIQGRDALLKSLEKRVFHCYTDEYLPLMFRPPRDGSDKSMSSSAPLVVGLRRTRRNEHK